MDLSNKDIIHVVHGKIEYLQFRRLCEYPNLIHAFGIKPLDFRVRGDKSDEKVPEGYSLLLEDLKIDLNTLVRPNQKHTNHVLVVQEKQNQDKPDIFLDYLDHVDGVVTNRPNITLSSTNADCIVLLLYDPKKQVIASVHSGWRGTFQKISEAVVQKMKDEFHCQPEDIIVGICPSIRSCHFEVDEDVRLECERIFEYTGQLFNIIKKGEVKEEKQKYYIDTIFITKLLLEAQGIPKQNVIDSGICSVCCAQKVHSRRADGVDFGLGAGIIEIKG